MLHEVSTRPAGNQLMVLSRAAEKVKVLQFTCPFY